MTQALPHIGNVVVFDASAGDNWSQPQHDDGGPTTAVGAERMHHHHNHHHQHHHHHQQQPSSQVLSTTNSTSKSSSTPSVPGDTVFTSTYSSSTITNTTNSSNSSSRGASGSIYTTTTNLTNVASIPLSSSSSFFATVSLPNSGPSSTIESPTTTAGSVISYTAALPQTTTASHPQGDPLTSHTGHRLLLLLQQQQQQQTTTTTTTSNTPLTSSLLLSSSPPIARKNKDNNIASSSTNINNLLKSSSGLVLSSLPLVLSSQSSASPGKKSDTTTFTTTTTTHNNNNNNNLLKSSPGLGLSSSSSSSSPSSSSFLSSHSSSCSFTTSSSLRTTRSPSTIITCPTGTHLPSPPRSDSRKFRGLAGSRGPSSSGSEATTTTIHPSSGEENYPRISATPEDGKERLASIEENLESSISAKARAKISNILQEVNQLSDVEKLLLYLKLPTGATSDDQLTLSPTSSLHASSRVEQTQAYTWIKSHLEEDSDICLPKQEVYEEYKNYCESLNLRPLSTADFGKIMKCVFPNIKPRRLGQRGQSNGIRKKLEVQPPVLPELEISPRKLREDDCYGRDELFSASCQLVCEWAEKLLERAFSGLRELSEFLVSNSYVNSKSMAAFTVSAAMQEAGILNSSAAMSSLFSNASGGDKHRETQLQLQRKLQEREMLKEQKRRLHQQRQENEHETKSPHRTRNESHTPGLPSPKTKFLSPSSCLRFRSSSSLENLLMPTAVSDNKSHIKDQASVPASGRERVLSSGNKPPAMSQDATTSAAQMKIYSTRSLFQDKSADRQCAPSEGHETRVPSWGGTKDAGPDIIDTKHSKTLELAIFHSLKKPSVIPVQSWADEKNSSTQQTSSTGPSNISAMLSTSAQTSADSLHKSQLLTTDINQNVSSDSSQSEKTVSCSTSNAFMLNMVLEKTSRVGTGVPLVSQTGSAKSAFVPFSQMHLQNIAETKTTQSTDYLPTSSQKSTDHSSEPSILAQMLECNDNSSTLASPNSNGNYIQVPALKSGWESEGGTSVSSTECVMQTSPSVTKRSRSRFAPIRPKAMQAKTILSLLQEQSGSSLDSTPYDRRRVATILKEKHAREQTEAVNQSTSSTPLPVTATAAIATSAFGSVAAATEVVTFPMNPVVSKPNELLIILGSPATGTVSAAGNVFLSPTQNSSNITPGATLDPQQATMAGTAIFQTIPSVNSSVASQTEMVLSNGGTANNVNTATTGETLAWKTIQLDTTALPHIAIPSQQLFTSLNPQQEAGSTSSLGIAVPLSGGLMSTADTQECTVDPSTQFMISKNIQLDGALLSGFNFNIADPSQSAHTISVSNLLPADLATPQVTVKMETAEPDNSLLMTTGQMLKRLSEESTSSILQQQQSTEIVNSTMSIGKFVLTNFGATVSDMCNEEPHLSAGGEDNSQFEVKKERSDSPTKPASLLRPLLNCDLLPGEFAKTKILNELLSTEDSLPECSLSNETDSSEKQKLETIDKSNIDNHPKNEAKHQSANSEKITLPVQMPITTALDSISTSVAAKTEKFSRRLRATSNQGSIVSTFQLHSRTLPAEATPATAFPSNPNPASAINVLQQLPLSHNNAIAVVSVEQLSNFASGQQNVTVSPSISSTSDLNACLLTDTVVTYSSQVTGDLSEPSLPEGKNHEPSPSFPINDCKDKANQVLRDLGVAPKQETGKNQPDIHPTSRKRKSSDKSSGSNTKRKQQSNKITADLVGQLDSSIATSPLVSSGQEWTTTMGTNIPENPEGVSSGLTTEPLQSPDISSVEKDALLDSAPQMFGLELSNAGSMHCMPTSKMSCHSQTMPSGTDNKTLPPSNLSSSQQFDRHLSDLLSLAQPLSIEGISPVSSVGDSASLSHSQLSLQGVPYSQLSPHQVNMATELAVFKRSVTDSVAALLQPTDQKNVQTSQGVPNAATQKCQFSQETPSLLQKHLTNMVDASLTDPPEEQQQQCVKSSFLCEMLQSSDISSKKDFFEEELPSDVADFITESMTSNQSESVFPNGGAGSSTNTSSIQPFPDLKHDVEDLLNQTTPPSTADAAAPPPVNTAADLGANVFVPENTLKHATTSVSILGEAETSHTLNSTQNRPFRDHLESSNTFAIPDAQAVVRKGVEVKQGRFSAATSHQPQQQASSVQATSTNESGVFRMSGQAPEFVAPNVTISQRWHTLSYEKTGSHTPVSDSGYSSASPIRSTPPAVPFSFVSSAENLVNNVIGHLEHRSASCEPPSQSPLAEPIQTYTPVATLQASNVSAGPSPTSLPPSPQTFTPIHGSSLSGTTYDPPPIRPTATVANKTMSTPQLNPLAVNSSQQPSKINKENNRELLNLLQAKSPPSYENAIRMLSQKSPRVAASSHLAQRSPVGCNVSDAQPQPQQIPTPATKPRSKARSRSTSNTATKSRRKRSMKESGCVETKETQIPQLVRCLSDNSALPSSSVAMATETCQPEADTKSDKDKSNAAADGPPSKTKKSVQISPAYPFSYKLSLLKDRSAVGGQVLATGDNPVVSVEHPPTASQASFIKLTKSGKVKQEEGLGSGTSAGGGSSSGGSGISSNQSVNPSRSQSVPLQNVTTASTQPKHRGRQQKKSAHISDLPNVNYMGNAPNVDLSRVFWEKLLTTTKSCTQGVTVTNVSSKGGNSEGTSTVNVVTAPTNSSTKRNLIQLLEDRTSNTEEVEEFKSNLDDLLGMHCLTAGDLQTLVGTEALNQSLLVTSVQPQIVMSSVSSTQTSAVSATSITTVPSSTPVTTNSSSSNSSVLEEELTAGAYQGQRLLNHSMSFSPHSMQ